MVIENVFTRQCKYAGNMIAGIPKHEGVGKRDEIKAEHKIPSAHNELRKGLKAWIESDYYNERHTNLNAVLGWESTYVDID